MMLFSLFFKWLDTLECPYRCYAERYLSKSVDRADFERREQTLKYKGLL